METVILTGTTDTGQREYCGTVEHLEFAKLVARDMVLHGGFYTSVELIRVPADGQEAMTERVVITSAQSGKVVQEHFGSFSDQEALELAEYTTNPNGTRNTVVHEKPKPAKKKILKDIAYTRTTLAKNDEQQNKNVTIIDTRALVKTKSYSVKFLIIACILSALAGASSFWVILALL